jgi:hypothetical protein
LSPYIGDNEADLTPYITDYLLMNLADFLKDNCGGLSESILKEYSNLLLQALESYPKICKDVNEEKIWSDWRLLNYIELFKLRQKKDESVVPVSPPRPLKINSPSSSEASSFHSFENLFNVGNNSPSKRQRKRTFDSTTAEGKQKT